MKRSLLEHYERELQSLREHGAWLARVSPERAATLAQSWDDRDPFVTQMVQAFAYTMARLELKLDDERERVPGAVLQMTYPGAVRPVPARAIVQFSWGEGGVPKQGRLIPAQSRLRPRALGQLEMRTASDTVVPPVRLQSIQLLTPGPEDRTRFRLQIRLGPADPNQSLRELEFRFPAASDVQCLGRKNETHGLRLFLGGTDSQVPLALYRALTQCPVRGAVLTPEGGSAVFSDDCIRPAGFDASDALLGSDPREPEGLRLMLEYAVFREKFLFVDIVGLVPSLFAGTDATALVDLYLDPTAASQLDGNANLAETVRLGCAPAVNLERLRLPSNELNRTTEELHLRPEQAEGAAANEIFQVRQVQSTFHGAVDMDYLEIFTPMPLERLTRQSEAGYYHTRRVMRVFQSGSKTESNSSSKADMRSSMGSDVKLSLIEFDPKKTLESGRTLQITADCFSRELPISSNRTIQYDSDTACEAEAVTQIQPPIWPASGENSILSLVGLLGTGDGLLRAGGDPKASLVRFFSVVREVYPAATGAAELLSGSFLKAAEIRTSVVASPNGVLRGTDIHLTAEPVGVSTHEIYLFLRVLDQVLSTFCSAGAFTRLTANLADGMTNKVLAQCPARAGKIALT